MTGVTVFVHTRDKQIPPAVPLETITESGAYDGLGARTVCVVLGGGDAADAILDTLGPHSIGLNLPDHWPAASRLERAYAMRAEVIFELERF